jgi:hypothetical protein
MLWPGAREISPLDWKRDREELQHVEQTTHPQRHDGNGYRRPINQPTVAFDAVPFAQWAPLFHVVCIEQSGLRLQWRSVGFPTRKRPPLDGADVGLFVAPPREAGLSALTDRNEPDARPARGRPSTVPDSRGRHGLVGMRERVALYGAGVHAANRAGDGFEVHVRLPLSP